MSLLKRIGGTPSTSESGATTAQPGAPRFESAKLSGPPREREDGNFADIRARVQNKLIGELDPKLDLSNAAKVRQQVEDIFNTILDSENIVLTRTERARMFESIAADILGFGPLETLLNDTEISEIMVNGPRSIYIERKGKLTKSDVIFNNDEHVMRVIDRIISPLGRRCDESSPMVDARLPDGSRVNAVIRPISLVGPCLSIRKFKKEGITVEDMIRFGSLTREMAEFLSASVRARLNVVVSGGTGSGKTTTLNALSSFIPEDERIITVENAAELQLRQEHVVTLESRPPNVEGKGEITIRDLVINCLRMRPERIVVGECRGGEALEMLQAMNTGHDGSMTTLHANTPRDALARIETMVLMAGMDLPVRAIREQTASAVDLIVHQARLRDGSRRITHVTEVERMEGDIITLQDIFLFDHSMGHDENGRSRGTLKATGLRPKFLEKLAHHNVHVDPMVFARDGG